MAREPDLQPLSDFRASLNHLKSLESDRLEELMTGTLDLCSHRLDAWITSFATKRLAEMRSASPTGVLFGGYGWVMNLKPGTAQSKVLPPPGEQGPVFRIVKQSRFRSHAFADAGFHRRRFCAAVIWPMPETRARTIYWP